MAPQTNIPVAANVLGTIGTVLWCLQLVPQIWTNWRTKKTDGFPAVMMFLWASCGPPFGVYAVVQNFNLPIQIQPQIFMALCLISWTQILIYHRCVMEIIKRLTWNVYGDGRWLTPRSTSKWAAWKATLLALTAAAVFAGIEAALIVTIRPLYNNGNELPVFIVGIVAAVLLAAGLLPPYVEIWKRRGRVIGFNWIFLTMDWFGAFFSLMALVAQNTFDILGGVLYILCCFLELGIFTSHIVWRFRTRKIRKEAAGAGKTFDDIAAEHEARGVPFRFAERKGRRKGETLSSEEEARERTDEAVDLGKVDGG